jgi:hypothetical protein
MEKQGGKSESEGPENKESLSGPDQETLKSEIGGKQKNVFEYTRADWQESRHFRDLWDKQTIERKRMPTVGDMIYVFASRLSRCEKLGSIVERSKDNRFLIIDTWENNLARRLDPEGNPIKHEPADPFELAKHFKGHEQEMLDAFVADRKWDHPRYKWITVSTAERLHPFREGFIMQYGDGGLSSIEIEKALQEEDAEWLAQNQKEEEPEK